MADLNGDVASGGGTKPPVPRAWRIALVAGIAAAAAVLVVRGLVRDDSSCASGDGSISAALTGGACARGAALGDGAEVSSLASLEAASRDVDFVFLLLPGDAGTLAGTVTGRIGKVAARLRGEGHTVGSFTMKTGTADFHRLVKTFPPKKFPLVLVAGKGCGSVPVEGDITEADLMRTFKEVSAKKTACCPGAAK